MLAKDANFALEVDTEHNALQALQLAADDARNDLLNGYHNAPHAGGPQIVEVNPPGTLLWTILFLTSFFFGGLVAAHHLATHHLPDVIHECTLSLSQASL